jgi:hypothetical protein
MTADSKQEWQALNAEIAEAYRRGAYAEAVLVAERALVMACQGSSPVVAG